MDKRRICRLIGHQKEYYPATVWRHSRRGYSYESKTTHVQCLRCGMSGGDGEFYFKTPREWICEWWSNIRLEIQNTMTEPADRSDDDIPF